MATPVIPELDRTMQLALEGYYLRGHALEDMIFWHIYYAHRHSSSSTLEFKVSIPRTLEVARERAIARIRGETLAATLMQTSYGLATPQSQGYKQDGFTPSSSILRKRVLTYDDNDGRQTSSDTEGHKSRYGPMTPDTAVKLRKTVRFLL